LALWEGRDESSIAAHADLDGASTEALGPLDRLSLGSPEAEGGELGGLKRARVGVAEHVGEGREVLDDLGRELLKEREELEADADARESRVLVAGIGGEGETVASEVRGDVRAARPKERADQLDGWLGGIGGGVGFIEERGEGREARAGREHGETLWPSAAQEAQEERLGPVVGGVAGRDRSSARVGSRVEEGGEASGPSPSLEV
jgi:hypothetical protein